ncbi:glutamic acid-rich protein isoform X2 [Octopus sinensis]|nr:glutamic acid-rich protein isoform X2 [Octopus sinensis]
MLPMEKKLFEEMAQKDKIRYDNEMANYVPPPGEIKRKRKQVKDPNAPKRCLSAFFIFCKDHRAKLIEEKPELKVSEVATLLGKMWKLSTPEVKKSYEERAAQDRKRYEKEMIIFRSQQVNVESPKAIIPVPKTTNEEFQPKAKVAKLKPEKSVKPQAPVAVQVKSSPSQPQLPPAKPMVKNAKITDNRTKAAKAQIAAQAARAAQAAQAALAAATAKRVAIESDDESEEEDDGEEGAESEEGEEGSSEAGEESSEEEEEEEGEESEGMAEAVVVKGKAQCKDSVTINADNNDDDEDDDDDGDEDDDDEEEEEERRKRRKMTTIMTTRIMMMRGVMVVIMQVP